MEGVKEQARVLPEEMEEVPALQEGISVGQIKNCSQDSAQNQAPSQEELVSRLQEQVRVLNEQVSCLSAEKKQLKQQNGEKEEEISRLKQALQTDDEKSGTWFPWCGGTNPPVKEFITEFRTSGKTGGCERQFLEDVSNLLSKQSISLKVKEASKDPLLVFCPIASRIGTDIENALRGLSGDQKAILVVMHLIPPDNTETFLDTRRQATHPAVVLTVHTRYTLQGGFYPCEMNKKAVASVASAIKGFAEDNLRKDSAAPRTPISVWQPPASTLALDPPTKRPRLQPDDGDEARPSGNQEGPGGGHCARDVSRPGSGHSILKAAAAAGTPNALQPEEPGTMSACKSHLLQKTKQKEVVSHHSEAMEGVKEQAHVVQTEKMEEGHAMQDKIPEGQIKTCTQASGQNLSSSQTDSDDWLVVDLGSPPPKGLSQEELASYLQEQVCFLTEYVTSLSAENKQLKQQKRKKDEEISRLKQEPTDGEKSGTWFPWWGGTSPPVKGDRVIRMRNGLQSIKGYLEKRGGGQWGETKTHPTNWLGAGVHGSCS